MRQPNNSVLSLLTAILLLFSFNFVISAQENGKKQKQKKPQEARPVTIPISIRQEKVKISDGEQRVELIEVKNLTIKENGEERTILSLRDTANSPLEFAVLIQDDLDSPVNLELKGIAEFIRKLPKGSRVMVGYLRGGSLQIKQKFTDDLEKAAKALTIISGAIGSATPNPYIGVSEAVERFNNLPIGRRAILLVSDGADDSRDIDAASPTQSVDLNRAITGAQRSGVAVYSIYADNAANRNGSSTQANFGQGALNYLAEETGGRAFFSGFSTPVSFSPFLRDLGVILSRQFALTYLSTSRRKDFRRIEVTSDNPEVKIEHPKGVAPR